MDLDYDSVKALASPTRLKILNLVLDEEATTTKLSDELERSKSTVSSHLKVLTDSGLLEKDEEEGRRRVIYRPTDKAKAIVNGKERKVKFSVVSSALTALGGVFFISKGITSVLQQGSLDKSEALEKGSSSGVGVMDTESQAMTARSMDAANQTTQNTSESIEILQNIQEISPELFVGSLLIILSLSALTYAYIHRKL